VGPVLLLGLSVAIARNLAALASHSSAAPPQMRRWLMLLEACAIASALAAAGLEWSAWRRGRARGSALAPVARGFVLLTLAWLALVLGQGPTFEAWRVDLWGSAAVAAWSLTLIAEPWIARIPRPLSRTGGKLLLAASCAVVLAELTLRAAAALHPRPILYHGSVGAREALARNRLAPHAEHLGSTVNSGGHNDDEFEPKRTGQRRVVSIGDSFSLYMATKERHFTALAEQHLAGVDICNLGVAAVGPPEYLLLLREEGLPLQPDLVLINVFVGNDLANAWQSAESARRSPLRTVLDADSCLLVLVPKRLAIQWRERRAGTGFGAGALPLLDADPARAGLELEADQPALFDPALETPTYSEESFLALELQRFAFLLESPEADFAPFFECLRALQELAAPVPMALMLIPDEFQVEDELWRACVAAKGSQAEWDQVRPQTLIRAFCAREGIPVLDLLPALRAVPPLEDGWRHLYHQRDTHFNARGQRAVGAELARFLAPLLDGAAPVPR
jgi:hypothetical protein